MTIKKNFKEDGVEVEAKDVVISEVEEEEDIMVKEETKRITKILIHQGGVEDRIIQGHMEEEMMIGGMIKVKLNVIIVISLAIFLGNVETK